MDVVMPKKLNFFKSQHYDLTKKGPQNCNFILPKPGKDHLVSSPPNTKDESKTPSTEPVADIRHYRQFILQPMSTLSYHLISSKTYKYRSQSQPQTLTMGYLSLHQEQAQPPAQAMSQIIQLSKSILLHYMTSCL